MSERQWRLVWATWAAAFVVAETVALRSGHAHAPLSHHMRGALGIRRGDFTKRAGQVAYGTGVAWLAAHLYKKAT